MHDAFLSSFPPRRRQNSTIILWRVPPDLLRSSDRACQMRNALAKAAFPKGALSSVGRASRLHREGQRFEPVSAHHILIVCCSQLMGPQNPGNVASFYSMVHETREF